MCKMSVNELFWTGAAQTQRENRKSVNKKKKKWQILVLNCFIMKN